MVSNRLRVPSWLAALLLLAGTSTAAPAQQGGGQQGPGPGVDREAMWPAATAEDWRRPCLITWQRTWEDAVAVSEETGLAILVCTNMDGEIASEHYAGIRYRQPEISVLYEPYVCVIASVYRHNPRDYDEEGRRVLCPRFGSVTCGEHIAIEPVLYEKFFDGRRIAPRHIMVELDGSESYDVFYAWDTDSVFKAIRDGIEQRPITPPIVVRGDRPIVERVASRDIADRRAVEVAYREGDQELRGRLLDAAFENMEAEPLDLLRLAVFGFDLELSEQARRALAEADTVGATGLVADALRVPMEPAERDALIGALERIGDSSPRAKTLSVVHRGLNNRSELVDVQDWSQALEGATASAVESYELEARLRNQDQVLEAKNGAQYMELAEAFFARGLENRFASDPEDSTLQHHAGLLFMDARRTALEAEKLGESGWKLDAVIALSSYYLHESDEAAVRAEAAVHSLPTGEASFLSMAVLELLAKLRCQAIAKAMSDKEDWPGQWLTDVNAACSVLAHHPLGTDAQIAWHYDILKWLGGEGQSSRVLEAGLARFPDSWTLHQRLRGQILRDQGIEGLETVYAEMLRKEDVSPSVRWYAGFAASVAAEFHRRRGYDERALAGYERAIALFQGCAEAEPELRDSADHQIALALGGRARIALEAEDYERALEAVLASFACREQSAATLDGLNISTVDTAKMLLARLKESGREELQAKLETALAGLDPELLQLPAYEFEGPPRGEGQQRGEDRRRRRGEGGSGSGDDSGG